MANEPPDLTATSHISIRRLISPLSRCILLVLLLSTSTGVLIRQLIGVTLKDLLALSVGILWFLGDLLPTVSLIVLIHDLLISEKKDSTKELFRVNGRPVTALDCIILLFSLLYLIDLLVSISCYISSFRHPTNDCHNLLRNYRYTFFHVQTLVAILYLTKPWVWTRLDLRKTLVDAQRLISLVAATIQSIIQRINPLSSNDRGDNPYDQQRQNDAASVSAQNLLSSPTETQVGEPVINVSNVQPLGSEPRATKIQTSRTRSSSSTRKRRTTSSKGVLLVVDQLATSRGGALRRQPRRRLASRALGASARQIVISRDIGRRRSSRGTKSLVSDDHLCNIQSDSARTVNLNLNMS